MKQIALWLVDDDGGDFPRAVPVEEVADADTERRLEDLLVAAPKPLLDDTTIVARQVQTAGGPLDLVGIDMDGRLVVFELKRGTLTRKAVAQILDYASDLAEKDEAELARLIEDYSGRGGTDKIDDFAGWYSSEYPDADRIIGIVPRMVIVGLGADESATRIVNHLARAGIDITLLTFHAFRHEGKLVLARQVESIAPRHRMPSQGQSREANLRALEQAAEELGAKELLYDVADFVERRIRCRRSPGKTGFLFAWQGPTYVRVKTNQSRRGAVLIEFSPHAEAAAPTAVATFLSAVTEAKRSDRQLVAIYVIVHRTNWQRISDPLGALLDSLVQGWHQRERVTTQDRLDEIESYEAAQ